MKLGEVVIHHIETAAKKAGVKFDADCRAELVNEFEALDQRLEAIETRLDELERTPAFVENWRDRRP